MVGESLLNSTSDLVEVDRCKETLWEGVSFIVALRLFSRCVKRVSESEACSGLLVLTKGSTRSAVFFGPTRRPFGSACTENS